MEEKKVKKIAERFLNDYDFKTFLMTAISSILMLVFAIFNIVIGLILKDTWTISIGIYYIALYSLKSYVIANEYTFNKRHIDESERTKKRINIYLFQSAFLFVIDLVLITPIILMQLDQKEVDYGTIQAIALAAYTVTKVTLASVNFKRTRKSNNLSVKLIRNINFIDALVSILTLQYTLIATFGEEIDPSMITLRANTSFIIYAFILIFSIIVLVEAMKDRKKIKNEEI